VFNSISHSLTYLLLGAAAALGGLLIAVAYDLRRKAREYAAVVLLAAEPAVADTPVVRNKGGRPKGSKNKPKPKLKTKTRVRKRQ
jgi:hypothetical protein